jgi:signal peptidase I
MEPTYSTGDLVITEKAKEYAIGDIIAFETRGGIVIHRIVGGNAEEGYVTRGDNKPNEDIYRPTPDQIVGRQWTHIEDVGAWLRELRQPQIFSYVLAAMLLLSTGYFQTEANNKTRRRRRKMGAERRHIPTKKPNKPASLPLPAPWLAAIALAAACLVAALALALAAFSQSPTNVSETQAEWFEHQSTFGYTALVEPSTLYPDGVVRPASPADESSTADNEAPETTEEEFSEPVYTPLLRSFTIDYTYTLDTTAAADLHGMIGMDLTIQAGADGWTRTRELVAARPFTGTTADLSEELGVAAIAAELAEIEDETGAISSFYTWRIEPRVDIIGEVGGEEITEIVRPSFVIEYDSRSLRPSAELSSSEPVYETRVTTTEPRVGPVSVSAARWTALTGLVLSLAVLAGLAAVITLSVSRDEQKLIRLRYSSMLMPVLDSRLSNPPGTSRLRVGTIHDLARLARASTGIIFEAPEDAGRVLYFVLDGEVAYEYLSGDWSESAVRAPSNESEPLEA